MLVPFIAGVLWFFFYPKKAFRILSKLGVVFFLLLAFVLLWSFVIDFGESAYEHLGLRTQSATNARFLIYIVSVMFWVSFFLQGKLENLARAVVGIVFVQVFLGLLMLVYPDFKKITYIYLSGYSGDERLLTDYFLARGFGWSEELFYLAPVFMLFSMILFFGFSPFFYYFLVLIGAVIVAFFNARIAAFGLFFAFWLRFGLIITIPLFMFVLGLVSICLFYFGGQAAEQFLGEFSGGRLRTLQILWDHHVHYLLAGVENIFGSHIYLYGSKQDVISDIGWVILVNYGGWFYLAAWLGIILILSTKAFPKSGQGLVVFLFIFLLGCKGIVTSGNAMMALLLALVFVGGIDVAKHKVLEVTEEEH